MQRLMWLAAGVCIAVLSTGYMSLSRASSDAAWKELADRTEIACLKASEFKDPEMIWSNLDFENQSAALVAGTWPQAHMQGQTGAMLCLYDKISGKTELREFDAALLKANP